jgi:hypothetical protein
VNKTNQKVIPGIKMRHVLNTYDFYKSYLTQIQRSSESILQCAKLVFNASKELSPPEFKKFCDAICATPTFITRMKEIHENKELTPSYTVMYELSILSDEELKTLLKKSQESSNATSEKVKFLMRLR